MFILINDSDLCSSDKTRRQACKVAHDFYLGVGTMFFATSKLLSALLPSQIFFFAGFVRILITNVRHDFINEYRVGWLALTAFAQGRLQWRLGTQLLERSRELQNTAGHQCECGNGGPLARFKWNRTTQN